MKLGVRPRSAPRERLLRALARVEELERAAAEHELLDARLRETLVRFEVSQSLAGKETEEQVLDAIIATAGIFPNVYVTLFTVDTENGVPVIVKRREAAFQTGVLSTLAMGARLDGVRTPTVFLNLQNEVFCSNDIPSDTRIDAVSMDILSQACALSYATIRLTMDDKPLALLMVLASEKNYFTEERIFPYRVLANQGAKALHTARLWETLRSSEQRLSLIVRGSPLAIVEWDASFQIQSWNRPAETMFGYTADEVIGKSGIGLLVATSERDVIEERMRRFTRDESVLDITRDTFARDGRVLVCEWVSAPRFGADGALQGAVTIIQDVTERTRVERELQESEDRYRKLSEATHEGVIIHEQGRILEANDAFLRMVGYTRAEANGTNIESFIAPEYRERVMWNIAKGRELSYEAVLMRRDESTFEARLVGVPTTYKGRSVRVATIVDITEEKRSQTLLEGALAVTQRRLRVSRALAEKDSQSDVLDSLIANATDNEQVHVSHLLGGMCRGRVHRHEAPTIPEPPGHIDQRTPGDPRKLEGLSLHAGTHVVDDFALEELIPAGLRKRFVGSGAHSGAFVPLRVGNELLGMIVALAVPAKFFDEGTLLPFLSAGDQGAAALRAARLRESVQASQRRLAQLIDQSPLPIIEWDAEFPGGGLESRRASGVRIHGRRSARQTRGGPPFPERKPGSPPTEGFALRAALEGTRTNLSKNRGLIKCVWHSSPLSSATGEIGGLVSIAEDITEQERRETAARATEQTSTASPTRCAIWCPRWMRTASFDTPAPRSSAFSVMSPPLWSAPRLPCISTRMNTSRMTAELRRGAADGSEHEVEYRLRHADGRYLWFSSLSRPHFDARGTLLGYVGGAREVTERRRADEEVRRLNEELEKRVVERTAQLESANRELEAFVSGLPPPRAAVINGFRESCRTNLPTCFPVRQ